MKPIWMPYALAELGISEIAGMAHEPRIISYHRVTMLKGTTDETPWCSAFACWVMEEAGIPSTKSAAARSWLKWGQECERKYGAIIVFDRRTSTWSSAEPASIFNGPGHVGFYVDEDATRVWILGGNQGDMVSVRAYPVSRILGARWPVASGDGANRA